MAERKRFSELTADEVEQVIRDNYDDIYKFCYWKVRNLSDAEDLTQEAFYRFIHNASEYSDEGKPKALLYTIARNLCINWYKKKKPLPLSDDMAHLEAKQSGLKIEERLVLEKCIEELEEEKQEILLLRHGQELQINEIAKIMKMSRFAVMYRLRNAEKELRKKLMREGFDFES